jgi:hypothetical protein
MRFDEVLDLVLGSRAEDWVSVAGDHNLDPEARWLEDEELAEEVVARRPDLANHDESSASPPSTVPPDAEPPSMSMAEERLSRAGDFPDSGGENGRTPYARRMIAPIAA